MSVREFGGNSGCYKENSTQKQRSSKYYPLCREISQAEIRLTTMKACMGMSSLTLSGRQTCKINGISVLLFICIIIHLVKALTLLTDKDKLSEYKWKKKDQESYQSIRE